MSMSIEELNQMLIKSSIRGSLSEVQYLVSKGADKIHEAYYNAATRGHKDIVRFLIHKFSLNVDAMEEMLRDSS